MATQQQIDDIKQKICDVIDAYELTLAGLENAKESLENASPSSPPPLSSMEYDDRILELQSSATLVAYAKMLHQQMLA